MSGMYTSGVGPELAGYLANDPPAGINSPDAFIFGHAGRSGLVIWTKRLRVRVPFPVLRAWGSSTGRALGLGKPFPICTTRPRGFLCTPTRDEGR